MSRQLLLFRHAKAEWDGEIGADHERKLSKSGEADARLMGKTLSQSGQAPQFVFSSSAIRAHTTAKLANKAGAWDCPIKVTDQLYNIQPDNVFDVIKQIAPFHKRIMLVGHEPTWSSLVNKFTDSNGIHMATGAIACLSFETDVWNEVYYGLGSLDWLIQPSLFRQKPKQKK